MSDDIQDYVNDTEHKLINAGHQIINLTCYYNVGKLFLMKPGTWLVLTEIGNCPSTTSLYSVDVGAPKLKMLCGEGRSRKEGEGKEEK